MSVALASLAVAGLLAVPPALISTTVTGSLEASIVRVERQQGPAVSAEIARLLRWRGDVTRQVHRGDRLDALVVLRDDGHEPDLLALHFAGEQIRLRAYRFVGDDAIARYYDAAGVLIEPVMRNAPVPLYAQITETLQHGRGKRPHNGIDLKAPEGSPVRMPFPGRVTRTNWSQRVNGHCIEVAFADGRIGRFLHLLRLAPTVRPGALLPVDSPLGLVGSTGHSNAPHLHYEIWWHGRPREPLDVHGRAVGRLAAARLPEFTLQRDAADRALLGPAAVAAETLQPGRVLPVLAEPTRPPVLAEPTRPPVLVEPARPPLR